MIISNPSPKTLQDFPRDHSRFSWALEGAAHTLYPKFVGVPNLGSHYVV